MLPFLRNDILFLLIRVSDNRKKAEMRSYEDSSKSKKSIASMIETKGNNSSNNAATKSQAAAATAKAKEAAEYGKTEAELDEETRMANLQALMSKRGKKGNKRQHVYSLKMRKKSGNSNLGTAFLVKSG